MNKRSEIDKIRRLLAQWYSGETDPDVERELLDLLENASDLPDDLAADRELLISLHQEADHLPEMPEEYSARIGKALDLEMAKERKIPAFPFGAFRRRWMWGAAGVAVCLFGAFITVRLMNVPEIVNPPAYPTAYHHPEQTKESDDTIRTHSLTLPPSESKKILAAVSVRDEKIVSKNRGIVKRSVSHNVSTERADNSDSSSGNEAGAESSDAYAYLSPDEEAMLVRNNYRVIRDAAEADE
ncbi:MAG: hypothetical protein K2G23_09090, partial [Muribaculaceae bacterium]|nr:hypothetical protein [Muribaculaceae bacterium]